MRVGARRRWMMTVGCGCALLAPSSTRAAELVRVAIPLVQVVGIPEGAAPALTSALAQGVALKATYRVISHAEIQQLLGLEAQKQLMGCDDSSCLTEIAGALDAAFLVKATVLRLGSRTTVEASMVEIATATVTGRVSQELKDDGLLPVTLRILGAQLVGEQPLPAWSRSAGIASKHRRWRVFAAGLVRGLGSHTRIRLDSAIPSQTVSGTLAPTAPWAFDVGQPSTGGGGAGLSYAPLPWLRVGVQGSMAHWAMVSNWYPSSMVAVGVLKTKGEPSQGTDWQDPVRQGCEVLFDPDQTAGIAEWGSMTRDATRLLEDGSYHNSKNSNFIPMGEESPVPTDSGECFLFGTIVNADVSIDLTAHPVSWLGLGLGLRFGFFTNGVRWGEKDQNFNGWQAGGLLHLEVEVSELIEPLPEGFAFTLALGALYQNTFEKLDDTQLQTVTTSPDVAAHVGLMDDGNRSRIWGAVPRLEFGLSYSF